MVDSNKGQIVSDGPTIDGVQTALELYGPLELENYPHSQAIIPLINEAFRVRHAEYWSFNSRDRFNTWEEILGELEPDYFTFILSEKKAEGDKTPRIFGTGSARAMVEHEKMTDDGFADFRGAARHKPGQIEAWELKILVADITLPNKGIGSFLQEKVEEEVKRRTKESIRLYPGYEPIGIYFTLTTLAEVNEGYYLRKGFKTTKLIPIKEMQLENIKACNIAHMEKIVKL